MFDTKDKSSEMYGATDPELIKQRYEYFKQRLAALARTQKK